MARKQNRAASSAAAAAHSSNTPTFTSFAAATAHALPTYPSNQPVHPITPWDQSALQMVKRLSKRDTTTKQKALAELADHINTFHGSGDASGQAFVAAWGPAFRAALEDDAPTIRSAALSIMALTVCTFRRLVQPIFPSVFPIWVAATGDLNPTVVKAASESLQKVLPTQTHREKVVAKFGTNLCEFVVNSIPRLSPSMFHSTANGAIAVLAWLLDAAQSSDVIASVIDDATNPLHILVKGLQKSSINAAPQVCDIAIKTLTYMKTENTEHFTRAQRFADLSVKVVTMRVPAGWDLVLTLFRGGWCHAYGDSFGSLPKAVCDAVTSSLPTGLQALLPLFDALPPTPSSFQFAFSVLTGMRDALRISDISEATPLVSVSYSLATLPTFLELGCFVHTVAASRWLSEDCEALEKVENSSFADYVSPTCCLFFSGQLPSTPQSQAGRAARRGALGTKGYENIPRTSIHEIAAHIARLLRALTGPRASVARESFAKAFFDSIDKPNLAERLARLEMVLNHVKELRSEQLLSLSFVEMLVGARGQSLKSALRAVAVLLSTRALNTSIEERTQWSRYQFLAKRMMDFAKAMLISLCESGTLVDNTDAVMDLGTLFSWVSLTMTTLGNENAASDIIDTLKRSCKADERYRALTFIFRAHKTRKEFDFISSWEPMSGKEYDETVEEALSACISKANIDACSLVAAAVDPSGGGRVSEELLGHIAETVSSDLRHHIKEDALDECTIFLINSPMNFVSGDRKKAFHDLITTSILRAPRTAAMMTALLTRLRALSRQDMLSLVESMIDTLQDAGLLSGSEEGGRTYATAVAKVIILVGEEGIADSVSLSQKLLLHASPTFTTEFLMEAPFRFVFGDGVEASIEVDRFTLILGISCSKYYLKFTEDMQAFVRCIGVRERSKVIVNIMDHYLTSGSNVHRSLLRTALFAIPNDAQNVVTFRLLSQRLCEILTHRENKMDRIMRIPGIIRLFSLITSGERLDELRDILEHAVHIVRAEWFSVTAGVATDIVAESLSYPTREVSKIAQPIWLKDLVLLCLRAVRKGFEHSRNKTKDQMHIMEAHATSLAANALIRFGPENVSEDDIRFWTFRSLDALRSCVEKGRMELEISTKMFKRFASITALSKQLINLGEIREPWQEVSSTVDELSHLASWVSVLLLPTAEDEARDDLHLDSEAVMGSRKHLSSLILKAAERGTLLTRESRIPLHAKYLYRLIPYMASDSASSRKAILTVLTHGATVDMRELTSGSFPKEGFVDEDEELRFSTEVFPLELRTALSWQLKVHEREVRLTLDARRRELGYFLAWRLFLDLIRSDDDITLETRAGSEDSSLRRLGVTYLRANSSIFATFLNKCIEVVVDGSVAEKAAAATAASMALEAEERAAQGIQLTRRENSKPPEHRPSGNEKPLDDHGLEEAVGHAAGVVFARALQRLPALSRDHIMDVIDRGTCARVESFVRKRVSPLLIAAEIRKVKEWGSFGGGAVAPGSTTETTEGELNARGSVAGREVWATYTFSDVTLEIGMRLPDTFPLQSVQVEARSRVGMTEARWRKTLLGMTTLLRAKDGTLAEAVELWRRNIDKTFQGAEECPICYSVLHLSTAALPKMQCRTCKNLFHSDCLCKWFTKSNSSACPLCRSAF